MTTDSTTANERTDTTTDAELLARIGWQGGRTPLLLQLAADAGLQDIPTVDGVAERRGLADADRGTRAAAYAETVNRARAAGDLDVNWDAIEAQHGDRANTILCHLAGEEPDA